MTTESNTAIQTAQVVDGKIIKKLPDTEEWTELRSVLREYFAAYQEQAKRRKIVNKLINELIDPETGDWYGVSNQWYIGPDLENKKVILELTNNANRAIDQMAYHGRRVRQRRKRIRPNRELFNNK